MRVVILFALILGFGVVVAELDLPRWAPYVLIVLWGYGVVLPLSVRFGLRRPVDPPIRAFDPGEHDATLEQLAFIARARAQLEPLGFRPLGELFIEWPRQGSGAVERALLVVLDNDAGTRAVATATTITIRGRVVHRPYVELVTRFAELGLSTLETGLAA